MSNISRATRDQTTLPHRSSVSCAGSGPLRLSEPYLKLRVKAALLTL
jgi:hypothetical protein